MSEFFRLCGNFSDHVLFPRRIFSHHVGIFPTMSEFFPIPILYAGKNPLLVDARDPRSIWCKQTLWVAVTIFPLLLRESSVICKDIFRKSAETLSFFLQCRWESKINVSFGISYTLKPNKKLTARINCFHFWSIIFQIGNLYVGHSFNRRSMQREGKGTSANHLMCGSSLPFSPLLQLRWNLHVSHLCELLAQSQKQRRGQITAANPCLVEKRVFSRYTGK